MSLVAVALLVALAAGVLAGGRLHRLAEVRLRSRRLVAAALAVQLVGALVGGRLHALGLACSALLAAAFLLRNRGLRGTGLVAAGLALVALVVGVNGAMPVSEAAASRAGADVQEVLSGQDPRHERQTAATRLPWLGDVVPVPLPWPEVVSPGDVLVAAGLAQLVVLGMRGAQRPAPCATLEVSRGARGGPAMAKKGRKKRARKKNKANHGNRPNA